MEIELSFPSKELKSMYVYSPLSKLFFLGGGGFFAPHRKESGPETTSGLKVCFQTFVIFLKNANIYLAKIW